jgi:hypothetical protein
VIAAALSYLFPVKAHGKVPHGSITMQLIRDGKIEQVKMDPPEGGPVNVKRWNGQRWEIIRTF